MEDAISREKQKVKNTMVEALKSKFGNNTNEVVDNFLAKHPDTEFANKKNKELQTLAEKYVEQIKSAKSKSSSTTVTSIQKVGFIPTNGNEIDGDNTRFSNYLNGWCNGLIIDNSKGTLPNLKGITGPVELIAIGHVLMDKKKIIGMNGQEGYFLGELCAEIVKTISSNYDGLIGNIQRIRIQVCHQGQYVSTKGSGGMEVLREFTNLQSVSMPEKYSELVYKVSGKTQNTTDISFIDTNLDDRTATDFGSMGNAQVIQYVIANNDDIKQHTKVMRASEL